MKSEKFLVEWVSQFSNRPVVFFLVWGAIVFFFIYLFWSLQKKNNTRYFREDLGLPKKKDLSVRKEEVLPKKER